jgi:hypothetical protein
VDLFPAARVNVLYDEIRRGVAMNVIPLHLRRKFERRWAARFASPVVSTARKKTDVKATIVKTPRPAHVAQGRQIGGTSCFPAFSEHSA